MVRSIKSWAVPLMFIAANLSLGLVISILASSQLQAMQMLIFVLLPSILLSGFMFPFDGMPPLAQGIAQVLPLTHFVELARGIILRGASLWEMPVPLGLAVLRFRKRLD